MGVRHKEYIIEGVQYHPESILTEEGQMLFRNFLTMRGGTWSEDIALRGDAALPLSHESMDIPQASVLDRIYAHRLCIVAKQKQVPSLRPCDLEQMHALSLCLPQIDFPTRLRAVSTRCSLMAEIKRASPSKGLINIDASAAVQARTYALAGAATISVLTEPEWFKGSIDDLRAARLAVDGMPHRPAILRKDFIFEEYQILEARLAGADTVLLIVKMLSNETLTRLYRYSVDIMGMEPLVEVNSQAEMTRAINLGAKVIGVNNRDLHSFNVDLQTTSALARMVDPSEVVLCALSGIMGREDVARYEAEGIGSVLVGEALMRAGAEVDTFIRELLGLSGQLGEPGACKILVKICGIRTVEAAKVAVEAGADLVGIILVEGAKRKVGLDIAKKISKVVHSTFKGGLDPGVVPNIPVRTEDWFDYSRDHIITHPSRALLVGVFQDQPLEYILQMMRILDLDMVQLHGKEPVEWARLVPVPVIKKLSPTEPGIGRGMYHAVSLLDSGAGGGEKLRIEDIQVVLARGTPVLVAGGLDATNVAHLIERLCSHRLVGVDVSSGVETEGRQDLMKIRQFVYNAKGRGEL